MFPIQAAVTMVSTGLLANLLGWTHPPVYLAAMILAACAAVLIIGKYPLFDKTMKLMMVILSLSTITAFALAIGSRYQQAGSMCGKFTWDVPGISFLVVLMGWMPSTIDISVWHSFWSSERIKQTNYVPTMKETLFDFHFGYWLTMILAVFFLGLGALVMYNSGEVFANSAVAFTGQVISLYTKALGQWSFPLIATAATVTMFSTSLSCFDAYTRIVREASVIVFPKAKQHADVIYLFWMIVLAVVSTVMIGRFIHSLKTFIDFATTLSFLAAPVFAYINYRTVTSDHMPVTARPGKILRVLSWIGIIFLSFFGMLYLLSKIFLSR